MLLLNRRYGKLKTRITVSFLCLVVLPTMLLSWLIVSTFHAEVTRQAITSSMELLEQVDLNASAKAANVEIYFEQLCLNDTIQGFLRYSNQEGATLSGLQEYFEKIRKYIGGALFPGTWLTNMLILSKSDIFYRHNEMLYQDIDSILESEWYESAARDAGRIIWLGVTTIPSLLSGEQQALCISRAIRDKSTLQYVGTVLLAINANYFSSLLQLDDAQGRIFILGGEGQLIGASANAAHTVPDLTADILERLSGESRAGSFDAAISGGEYLCIYTSVSELGWRTVRLMPTGLLTANLDRILPLIVGALVACAAIFVAFLLLSYRSITRPLQYMANLFNEIEASGKIDLARLPSLEMLTIGRSALSLVRKNRDTQSQLERERREKDIEELKKLQAQVNPHFLYNTLSTIRIIASHNGDEDVAKLLGDLHAIMKNMASRARERVTVREELDSLRSYIRIESTVYDHNIDFAIEEDPSLLDCRMPNFLLQPLVENAIFHGIDPASPGGKVGITCQSDGIDILFRVSDNGRGMTAEQIDSLLGEANLRARSKAGMSGLGLYGIHKKLMLIYGAPYGVHIESTPGQGTRVTVRLPREERREP